MEQGVVMALGVASVLLLLLVSIRVPKQWRLKAFGMSCVIIVCAWLTFIPIRGETPKLLKPLAKPASANEYLAELQSDIKQDRNNAELWFQLGHAYLLKNEFDSALTCFDYAIRLSPSPTASQLAAKATSLYYLSSQRITPQVDLLLTKALELETNNLPALTLIANDYFYSFRYQDAIDTWVQILDSGQRDIDRVSIVESINRAKALGSVDL